MNFPVMINNANAEICYQADLSFMFNSSESLTKTLNLTSEKKKKSDNLKNKNLTFQ